MSTPRSNASLETPTLDVHSDPLNILIDNIFLHLVSEDSPILNPSHDSSSTLIIQKHDLLSACAPGGDQITRQSLMIALVQSIDSNRSDNTRAIKLLLSPIAASQRLRETNQNSPSINPIELIHFLRSETNTAGMESCEDVVKQLFNLIDSNHDGSLTKSEILKSFQRNDTEAYKLVSSLSSVSIQSDAGAM